MTRRAIEHGFERYLADLVDATYDAFDVAAVLRGSRGGGSRAASKLLKNSRRLERRVVRPALTEYERSISRQFETVADYAAGEAAFETYADEILAHDIYWNALRAEVRGERRETIRERLLDRQRTFGDDLAPVVDAAADEFAPAVAEAYDRADAVDLVETHLEFSTPLKTDRRAFAFELDVDPGEVLGGLARALPSFTVEFTDEALRSMRRAEQRIIPQARADVERAFES